MAQLKIFLNGQFQEKRDLDPSREFLVGRGEACDYILGPERGISRQHFRIKFSGNQWNVEVLSRHGELYRNGDRQSSFLLRDGTTFSVPPYEFVFESEELAGSVRTGNSRQDLAAFLNSGFEEDKTHIGYVPAVAYFRLVDQQGHPLQSYQLEGTAWVGGRETNCNIYIANPKVSRKQFEVQKQDETYFIRDFGSVNVTLLNGRPLSVEDWTQLQSGDVVSAADWNLHFEMRDLGFQQRLQDVDPALLMSGSSLQGFEELDSGNPEQVAASQSLPGYEGYGAGPHLAKEKPGMKILGRHIPGLNPIRLIILVLIVGGALFSLTQNSDSGKNDHGSRAQSPFERLSSDKQQLVKQFYLTGQSLFAQGRYELAKQEIVKLHQIIPSYEDSKQIEEAANQGLLMLAERERAEADERQKALTEQKVQKRIAECRAQINDNSEMAWLEDCLAPVMEFNPEHPAILTLKREVDRLTTARALRSANQQEYNSKVAAHKALFEKAKKVEKEGLPIPAIKAYQKVLQSGLPDPQGLNQVAKRQIASLQGALESRQLLAEKNADVEYRAGHLRKAILILRDGILVNPENEGLKGKHATYLAELRKQMMTFYQEGILEESVGEVEPAKNKWRKILDQSLPGEDYYEKAKMKMKKYGAF